MAAIALQSQQSLMSLSPSRTEARLQRSYSIGSLENKRVPNSQVSQFAYEMAQNNILIEEQLQKERSEKEELMLKLKEAQEAILKKAEEEQADNTKIHLALLFASPLVFSTYDQNDRPTFKDIPLLEFENEFDKVEESLIDTNMEVRVKIQQATQSNLTKILTSNPLSLHFTGHGVDANETSIKNEGNCLIFETQDGEADLVTEKLLTELIQQSDTKLEFVYVASCHSEFAGEIFLNAGAKHVICIRGDQELSDQAAIVFSQSFYNSVFKKTLSVCSSFNFAKKCVEKQFGKQEALKYLLLKHPKHKHNPKECILKQLKSGKIEKLDNYEVEAIREIPAKVEGFVGRQNEMYQVLKNIHNNRLVSLLGLPGIGKTSLAKNLIFYLMKRNLFRGGVIFISIKGQNSFDNFLKAILLKVKKAVSKFFNEEMGEKLAIAHHESLSNDQIQGKIIQILQQIPHKFLIILDNIEEMLFNYKANVGSTVMEMLQQVENCNFLVTSRPPLGIIDFKEKILVLKELSTFQTMKLFISRAEEIPEEEINELLCYTEDENVLRSYQEMNKKKRDSKLKKDKSPQKTQYYKKLADHHLFKIFSGNPHAIVLAAPLIGTDKMRLIDLYKTLNSKEMHEILQVDGIENCSMASLRVSLEASVNVLKKQNQESLSVFYLIGLLPGGVNESQLEEMVGAQWQKSCKVLTDFSLVSEFMKEVQLENPEDESLAKTIHKQQMTTFETQEEEEEGKEITVEKLQKKISFGLAEQFKKTKIIRSFNIQPFMNSYVEAKAPTSKKKELQKKICQHYVKMLRDLYRKNAKLYANQAKYSNAVTQEMVIASLLKHETNIRACIDRIIELNGNKDDQEERIQRESFTKDLENDFRAARIYKSNTMKIKDDDEKSVTFKEESEDISLNRQSVDKSPLFSKAITSESKKQGFNVNLKQIQSDSSATPFNDKQTVVQTFSNIVTQPNQGSRNSQPYGFNVENICMTQRNEEEEKGVEQIIDKTKMHAPISTKNIGNKDTKFNFAPSVLSSQKSKCYLNRNSKVATNLRRINSGMTMQKQKTLRQSLMTKNTFGKKRYQEPEDEEDEISEDLDEERNSMGIEDISEEEESDSDSFGTDDDINRHTSIVEIDPIAPPEVPKVEKKGLLQIQIEEDQESEASSAQNFFPQDQNEQLNSIIRASQVHFGQQNQEKRKESVTTDENLFTDNTEKRKKNNDIRVSGVDFEDQQDASSSGDEYFPQPGQQELNKVIRDSQVFFKKQPSSKDETYSKKATVTLKRASTAIPSGRKRSAVPEESNEEDSEDEWEQLNLQEELVVYYLLNLVLANQDEQALKFLEKYAFKVSKNSLFLANIYKIQGLIVFNSKKSKESIKIFEKSQEQFKKCDCIYGQSICNLAHGFILKAKFEMMDEEIFQKHKQKILEAYSQFEEIDHLPGQSLCIESLSFVANKEKDKKAQNSYQSKSIKLRKKLKSKVGRKDSFHVNRLQGPFFSILIEIIDGAWYNKLSEGLKKSQQKPQSPEQPSLAIGKAKSEQKQLLTSFMKQDNQKMIAKAFGSPQKTSMLGLRKDKPEKEFLTVGRDKQAKKNLLGLDSGKKSNVFELRKEENMSLVPMSESIISIGEESKRNSVISEDVGHRKLPNQSNIKQKDPSMESAGIEMVYHPHPSLFPRKNTGSRAETPKFQEPDRPAGDMSPRPNMKASTHSPEKKEKREQKFTHSASVGKIKNQDSVVLCEDEELKTPQYEKSKYTKSLLEPGEKDDTLLVRLTTQSARANAIIGPQLQSFKNQFTSLFSSNVNQELSRQQTQQSNSEGKNVPVLSRAQVRFQTDKL